MTTKELRKNGVINLILFKLLLAIIGLSAVSCQNFNGLEEEPSCADQKAFDGVVGFGGFITEYTSYLMDLPNNWKGQSTHLLNSSDKIVYKLVPIDKRHEQSATIISEHFYLPIADPLAEFNYKMENDINGACIGGKRKAAAHLDTKDNNKVTILCCEKNRNPYLCISHIFQEPSSLIRIRLYVKESNLIKNGIGALTELIESYQTKIYPAE